MYLSEFKQSKKSVYLRVGETEEGLEQYSEHTSFLPIRLWVQLAAIYNGNTSESILKQVLLSEYKPLPGDL